MENETLREKLVKKGLERKWKTDTIRTPVTKLNAVNNDLASLTNEDVLTGTLLSTLDENILFNFDLKAIQKEVDILFQEVQKQRIIHGDMFKVVNELKHRANLVRNENLARVCDSRNLYEYRIYDKRKKPLKNFEKVLKSKGTLSLLKRSITKSFSIIIIK